MLGAKIFSRSLFRESYYFSAKEFFSGLGTDSMILRNIMRINPFEKKSRNKNAIILTAALSCWKNEKRELRISLGVVNKVRLGLVRSQKSF